jgi:hypothetical protein
VVVCVIWEIILRDFWGAIGGSRVTKEVIGIHVLRTRSPFVPDILRRGLPPVSLARSTFAPGQF